VTRDGSGVARSELAHALLCANPRFGFCARCFKRAFPNDPRSTIIYEHTKETCFSAVLFCALRAVMFYS
jgi:hypothetical protein